MSVFSVNGQYRYEPRQWVMDGDRVWLRLDTRMVPCVVTCAAGNHARVRTQDGNERWAAVDDEMLFDRFDNAIGAGT